VKQSAWLGIAVGTLIAALGLWFGLFAIQSNLTIGLAIISVAIIFAMYAMTIFNGVEDASTVAFHSSLYAIVTATFMVILFTATDSPSYVVATPVLALGVGGVVGIPPTADRFRLLVRAAGALAATGIAVAVYWVDPTVYAIVAPLMPLPAVGLIDGFSDRVRDLAAAE
jgi:hypothetical protein